MNTKVNNCVTEYTLKFVTNISGLQTLVGDIGRKQGQLDEELRTLMDSKDKDSTYWTTLFQITQNKQDGLRSDFNKLVGKLNHPTRIHHSTTGSAMDVRTHKPPPSPHWTLSHMPPSTAPHTRVTVDERMFNSQFAMPPVSHLSIVGSPQSWDRHIVGLPIDIQQWHGDGDLDSVAEGCLMLSE